MRERGQEREQPHMVSEQSRRSWRPAWRAWWTCWLVLLALEPGIEVDIRATCGGLGRPMTSRDRRRLWRKVRQWEAFRGRKAAVRDLRGRAGWSHGRTVVSGPALEAMGQARGSANGALSGEAVGWASGATSPALSEGAGERVGSDADREMGGKAAEWVDAAAERTELGATVVMNRSPVWREEALDMSVAITEMAEQNDDVVHRSGSEGEGEREKGVASGAGTGWGAERAEHGPALMMVEEIPSRVREAIPHEPFGDMGEQARDAASGPAREPCVWECTRAATTCTARRHRGCRAYCGGPMRGDLDRRKSGEALTTNAGYMATTARVTARMAAQGTAQAAEQGESCGVSGRTSGGGYSGREKFWDSPANNAGRAEEVTTRVVMRATAQPVARGESRRSLAGWANDRGHPGRENPWATQADDASCAEEATAQMGPETAQAAARDATRRAPAGRASDGGSGARPRAGRTPGGGCQGQVTDQCGRWARDGAPSAHVSVKRGGGGFVSGGAPSVHHRRCQTPDCSWARAPVENCGHAQAHYSTPVAVPVATTPVPLPTTQIPAATTPRMTFSFVGSSGHPIAVESASRTWTTNLRLGPQGTGHNMPSDVGALALGDRGSRVDERSRIESLLVMGGIERHPGPDVWGQPAMLSTLTHDACIWVFDSAIWTAKTDKFADRVRAVLRHFQPGSMPHRRIARIATEAVAVTGESVTDETRWTTFVTGVRQLLPHNALSEQDYLRRLSRKGKEPWLDFMDRYALYADTCQQVSAQVKAAELFRKLPRDLRLQLSHLPHDASLNDLMNAVRGIRYWSHCAQDTTIQFDPMELDHHTQRAPPLEDFGVFADAPAKDFEFW